MTISAVGGFELERVKGVNRYSAHSGQLRFPSIPRPAFQLDAIATRANLVNHSSLLLQNPSIHRYIIPTLLYLRVAG